MKSYDYEAYTHDCSVYCIGCVPPDAEDDELHPIFADSEWDSYPICDACGNILDYVMLIGGSE